MPRDSPPTYVPPIRFKFSPIYSRKRSYRNTIRLNHGLLHLWSYTYISYTSLAIRRYDIHHLFVSRHLSSSSRHGKLHNHSAQALKSIKYRFERGRLDDGPGVVPGLCREMAGKQLSPRQGRSRSDRGLCLWCGDT
jgi:hypothetical protein